MARTRYTGAGKPVIPGRGSVQASGVVVPQINPWAKPDVMRAVLVEEDRRRRAAQSEE